MAPGVNKPVIYATSIQHNRIFSPTLLNELVLSSHRSNHESGTLANDKDWPKELGFPNPFNATGWPTFGACLLGGSQCFSYDSDNRHDQKLTSHVAEDNLTWIRGKHSLKFGGKVRFEYDNIRELQQAQGSHSFNPTWTCPLRSGQRSSNAVYRCWSSGYGAGTFFDRESQL